jgi:hypothetical protein
LSRPCELPPAPLLPGAQLQSKLNWALERDTARRFGRGRFSRSALIRSRRAYSPFKSVFEGGDPFALNASQAAEVMGGNLVEPPKA